MCTRSASKQAHSLHCGCGRAMTVNYYSTAAAYLLCREYPELSEKSSRSSPKFKLALHCGGCMIDAQKMRARIADMEDAGVPVTNYGLFLSYVQSPDALKRVLEPWGVQF